jgi:hypothetical protein
MCLSRSVPPVNAQDMAAAFAPAVAVVVPGVAGGVVAVVPLVPVVVVGLSTRAFCQHELAVAPLRGNR